jgi:hypothetical protein
VTIFRKGISLTHAGTWNLEPGNLEPSQSESSKIRLLFSRDEATDSPIANRSVGGNLGRNHTRARFLPYSSSSSQSGCVESCDVIDQTPTCSRYLSPLTPGPP